MSGVVFYKDVPVGCVMRRADEFFLKIMTAESLHGHIVNAIVLNPGSNSNLHKMEFIRMNPLSTVDEYYNNLLVCNPSPILICDFGDGKPVLDSDFIGKSIAEALIRERDYYKRSCEEFATADDHDCDCEE